MHANKKDEVWITGMGLGTPLGCDYATVADRLMAGSSGVRTITAFDTSKHHGKISGILPAISCPEGLEPARFARQTPWEQLLLWCAVQALRDAGWWERRSEIRVGLVLGIGAEWMCFWDRNMEAGGHCCLEPELDRDGFALYMQEYLQLHGPISTVAAACASGNVALGVAKQWIRSGFADVVIAGAAELPVTPLSLAGFGNLRALSRRNDTPTTASRPFDRERDGFVMAEGGALFVLESGTSARRRGATGHAVVAGFGATSDAYHLVSPSNDPQYAAQAIRLALRDARANADEIDYVNAHATSTPVGDIFESRALRASLGEAVDRIPVSGTKSMTGHMLGAASAVEAAFCVMSLARQTVPPTINLNDPDPECALCHVANHAQERSVRTAISTSFGFGGSNTCLVLRQVA